MLSVNTQVGGPHSSNMSAPVTNEVLPSFKFKFSLGFITSCYVIFSLSMVQAMDIFMIT